MLKIKIRLFILLVLFASLTLVTNLSSQNFPEENRKTDSALSLMGLGSMTQSQMPEMERSSMLIGSVDENEYQIDAGDVFVLKIDVKGPAIKIFNTGVTPDGYLVIPDAPSVYVRHLTLNEAKKQINKILEKSFPNATIESHLMQVHKISVDVLGALPKPGKISLTSLDRLFDAVNLMVNPSLRDTTNIFDYNVISFRNVEVRSKNTRTTYDLLTYKLMGDREQNPYLLDEDIVYVNFRDTSRYTISVEGAVARPLNFEFKSGDKLLTAVQFASGLLPVADANRIELVRFNEGDEKLSRHMLSFPKDSTFVLQPDDRIYMRPKSNYPRKHFVYVEGEVNYPGQYAIENGKTTLSEIIKIAGGFTGRAAIELATLQRKKDKLIDDQELLRLKEFPPSQLTAEEGSFVRQRTRENRYIVSANFNNLEAKNDEDVLLFDKDLIIIPLHTNNVFVSGGVNIPGNFPFRKDWNFEDYIQAAGGYSDHAREGWVSVIDFRTGKWKDADFNLQVNEGDIIFVPERDRTDWYRYFLDSIAIVAQVSAIIVLIVTLSK